MDMIYQGLIPALFNFSGYLHHLCLRTSSNSISKTLLNLYKKTLLGSLIKPFSNFDNSEIEISVSFDSASNVKFLLFLFSLNISPNNLIKISPFFFS